MKEGLTTAERISVVSEAIRLIQRPDTFVQGTWKCPVFERPGTGEKIQGMDTMTCNDLTLVPAKDKDGRPLFAYCVEGAINQAGINILGSRRALALGASDGKDEPARDSRFTEYLSVNEVARVMFAELFEQYGYYGQDIETLEAPAQFINDDFTGDEADYEEPDPHVTKEKAHSRVMDMLRQRLSMLQTGQ